MEEEDQRRKELTARVGAALSDLSRVIHLKESPEWYFSLDVTMPQFKVLLHLYLNGETHMAGLASALGVQLPTVTGLIDRLVERGLVRREEAPHDRRLVLARLTEAGQEMIQRMWWSSLAAFDEGIMKHVSTEDLETVARAIDILYDAAQRGYGSDESARSTRRPPSISED